MTTNNSETATCDTTKSGGAGGSASSSTLMSENEKTSDNQKYNQTGGPSSYKAKAAAQAPRGPLISDKCIGGFSLAKTIVGSDPKPEEKYPLIKSISVTYKIAGEQAVSTDGHRPKEPAIAPAIGNTSGCTIGVLSPKV